MPLSRKTGPVAASVLATASLVTQAADVNPLVAEQWRSRPLLVIAPTAEHPLIQDLRSQLQDANRLAAFAEREMVLFTVIDGQGRRGEQTMTSGQTRGLLSALGATIDMPATVFLIGKDGGVKLSESGNRIELETVFALIDTMPMRKR